MAEFAALIPAAGYSSRMGDFKPLLSLPSSLVIEKAVQILLEAGVNDIRVICGYKADLLSPIVEKIGVRTVFNPFFAQGMYSSIQKGVKTMESDIQAFFLLPADYVLVNPTTIKKLMQAYNAEYHRVVYPLYQGRRGHPPLISMRLKPMILERNPARGLRELLGEHNDSALDVETDDPGILMDMDTKEDYHKVLEMMNSLPRKK